MTMLAIGTSAAPQPVVRGGNREPLPASMLADIAAGFAVATPLWSDAVRHDPDGRRPVRLVSTDRYEVWVIGWTTGQSVEPHDHGDSAGAIVVTEGELVEVLPRADGEADVSTLVPDRLRHLPLGTVHDVLNRSAAPATSIHVYSPPLATMTYYDPLTLAPLRTEPVPGGPPAVVPSAASVVLHPARRSQR